MEMVAGVAIASAVCVAAGFVTLRGAGAAAQVMTQMFASPAELGWPSGIQEDDDFHWRWSGRPGVRDENEVGPGRIVENPWNPPEIVELRDGSGPRPSPVTRH